MYIDIVFIYLLVTVRSINCCWYTIIVQSFHTPSICNSSVTTQMCVCALHYICVAALSQCP